MPLLPLVPSEMRPLGHSRHREIIWVQEGVIAIDILRNTILVMVLGRIKVSGFAIGLTTGLLLSGLVHFKRSKSALERSVLVERAQKAEAGSVRALKSLSSGAVGVDRQPQNEEPVTLRPKSLADLWQGYNVEDHGLDRWLPYADVYDAHLPPREMFSGVRKLKLLEIGIQSGGSARAWKQWYGSALYYVGVDIDSKCLRTQNLQEDIHVEIGSQLDPTFLLELCATHGPFDVVIDDGGHTASMIKTAFATLFPNDLCMAQNSTYFIEDTHTMVVMGHYCTRHEEISDMAGELWFYMHWRWQKMKKANQQRAAFPAFSRKIASVHLYDSMAVIKRGGKWNGGPFPRLRRGSFFKNKEDKLNAVAGVKLVPIGPGFQNFTWGG